MTIKSFSSPFSTTTTTTTIDPPKNKVYRLVLTNSDIKIDSEEILNKLMGIVNKFFSWEDLLSMNILNWSKETMDILPTEEDESNDSPEQFLKKVQAAVDKLFKEVLLSDLLKKPLKNPVLEGPHTWDLEELEEYRNKYGSTFKSPLTKAPISYDVVIKTPHLFAIEIKELANSIFFSSAQETSQAVILPQNILAHKIVSIKENDVGKLKKLNSQLDIYLDLGANARQELRDMRLEHLIQKREDRLVFLEEKMKAHLEWAVNDVKKDAEQKAKMNLALLEASNKSHDTTVHVLEGRIQDRDHNIDIIKEKLTQTEEKVKVQDSRISSLEDSNRRLIDEVRNRNRGGRGCTLF